MNRPATAADPSIELNRDYGISVLLVSHGSFAESAADRVVHIGGGRRRVAS